MILKKFVRWRKKSEKKEKICNIKWNKYKIIKFIKERKKIEA